MLEGLGRVLHLLVALDVGLPGGDVLGALVARVHCRAVLPVLSLVEKINMARSVTLQAVLNRAFTKKKMISIMR